MKRAGQEGIILVSGDGAVRRCYPILAAYIGDYPEQTLVALVKSGNCPICPAPRDDINYVSRNITFQTETRIVKTTRSYRRSGLSSRSRPDR